MKNLKSTVMALAPIQNENRRDLIGIAGMIRDTICVGILFPARFVSVAVFFSGLMLLPVAAFAVDVNVINKGAVGDGSTDNTAAIQAAIDQVGGTNGTVLVPDGTYMIDAVTSLKLKSDMTFRMTEGAILKAITNNQTTYAIVLISSVSDVHVIGGTVQGERATHIGINGEWGMGIWITGSTNILIDSVTATDCWGDGFYLGGPGTTNITLQNVVADNNCRQGLSIVDGNGIVVKNSVFKNTNGAPDGPWAGIDIEPNAGYTVINNIQILNNEMFGNQGGGVMVALWDTTTKNITISGNNVHNNAGGGAIRLIGAVGVVVNNNIVSNNSADGGIYLQLNTIGSLITGNIIANNTGHPLVLLTGSTGNTVTGNTITSNGISYIRDDDTTHSNTISGNFTIAAPAMGAPTALSTSSIRWNFIDNTSDETGFRLYNDIDIIVVSSAATNLTYLDETGLIANTQYSGRYAIAYNGTGTSAPSSVAAAIYTLAPTPANLAGTAGETTMDLSVDSFPHANSGSSGYYFSRTGVNSGWIQTNAWRDTGLTPETSYTYSVMYRNGDGVNTSSILLTKSTNPHTLSTGRELLQPTRFALLPAYPNPFNAICRIAFSLPEKAMVRLAVYTSEGKRVKTLVAGTMDAGVHRIAWDGTSQNGKKVAEGLYVCVFITGNNVFTGKVVYSN